MGDFEFVQSLKEAHAQQAYDVNRPYGDKEVDSLGQEVLIAQVTMADRYSQPWVVTLAPVTTVGQQGARAGDDSGWNPQLISDAFAVIEWGMGGASHWAVVDWTAGQQFTVVGSFVRVWGVITAWSSGPGPVVKRTRMAGHVTPGYTTRAAIRTILYGDDIAVNTTTELPVPAFAREVTASAIIAADADLALFNLAGNAGALTIWTAQPGVASADGGPVRVNPTYMAVRLPLPIGTNAIAWTNEAAASAAILRPRLRYELSLS